MKEQVDVEATINRDSTRTIIWGKQLGGSRRPLENPEHRITIWDPNPTKVPIHFCGSSPLGGACWLVFFWSLNVHFFPSQAPWKVRVWLKIYMYCTLKICSAMVPVPWLVLETLWSLLVCETWQACEEPAPVPRSKLGTYLEEACVVFCFCWGHMGMPNPLCRCCSFEWLACWFFEIVVGSWLARNK